MSFRTPEALWLLLLLPVAVALLARAARKRREAVALFFGGREPAAEQQAERMARVRRWRGALLTAGLACLVVALAGPRFGETLREARQESLDLLVALDVSASMHTEDVAPDRLARARLAIARLAEERPGDRIGLLVFAGDAFLQSPLTTDRSAFRLFLDAAGPDLVGIPGTDFGRMLLTARQAFLDDSETPGLPRTRALVVVSDGENHEEGLDDALDALRDDGIVTLVAGVGTETGGPVPIVRDGRRVGFKTDASGRQVVSRLEEGVLRELAGRGEAYVRLSDSDAVTALNDQLDRLDRTVLGSEEYAASAERFQWPLAFGLLLLFAERLLALRAARPPEPIAA